MEKRLAQVDVRISGLVTYKITDCDGNHQEIICAQNDALDEAFEKGLFFHYPLGVDIPLYIGK